MGKRTKKVDIPVPEVIAPSAIKLSPRTRAALAALSPTERVLAVSYGMPDSATYLNGTRSYLKAHPTAAVGTGKSNGHRTLTKAHVQTAIATLMEESGFGRQVRIDRVCDISNPTTRVETETTRYDAEGEVLGKVVTRSPVRPDVVLKAVDLANRMDGLYAEQRIQGDAAKHAYYAAIDDLVDRARRQAPTHARKQRTQKDTRSSEVSSEQAGTHASTQPSTQAQAQEPAQAPEGGVEGGGGSPS